MLLNIIHDKNILVGNMANVLPFCNLPFVVWERWSSFSYRGNPSLFLIYSFIFVLLNLIKSHITCPFNVLARMKLFLTKHG